MRISCGLLPWVVVTGQVVLLWRLFVRTNVCGVGRCSLLLVRLDNMCVTRARWVVARWMGVGKTHRWPHVMEAVTRCDVRCVTGLELTGRTFENTRSTAISLNRHLHLRHSESQRVNAKFVASIRRREHGAKVGGADIFRLEKTSANETKTSHTEECGERSCGGRGKRQRCKRWHGQEAEAQELLRGDGSSYGNDARTAAKRARHQNFVRRRVRHLHRFKPAARSGGGKRTNAGPQRRSAPEGPWSRSGTTVHLVWAGLVQGLIFSKVHQLTASFAVSLPVPRTVFPELCLKYAGFLGRRVLMC